MKVHSLVIFENGTCTEVAKEFDLSAHNSVISPETHDLVEDNYMTFFYPSHLGKEEIYDYADQHGMHFMESFEISLHDEKSLKNLPPDEPILYENWDIASFREGYKMFRVHYWTETPTRWTLNPDVDLFVFNSKKIKNMVLYN